jgi:membrane protease YdiL (CAAX protease family)
MERNAMTHAPSSDWRLAHGGLFVLIMASSLLIPPLRQWPWLWVAPLLLYFSLALAVPHLRNSLSWLRLGRLRGRTILATVALVICTVCVLVTFQSIAQPDTALFRKTLLVDRFDNVLLGGTLFAVVNAVMEELVFRGILFDAIDSQSGAWISLIGTAVLFGLGHLHGYPPGTIGVVLAMLFGLALGALRLWAGGLLSPILAHIAADATIYSIVVTRT